MLAKDLKAQFPILQKVIRGKPLIYLDHSASSQKPQCVIDAISHYYQNSHANVHRGIYELSARATQYFEATRTHIQTFINAKHSHEIIFVRGATEGINLVAQTFGRQHIQAGDEILISAMEHHSNIVPWQMICAEKQAFLRVIPILENGELDKASYQKLLNAKTKLVAITHASNVLGTLNPIKELIALAHSKNIPVLVDGAQAFPHRKIDVQDLDCDFYVFSSHKAYGPTGVGVLYGKTRWLETMPPYQGGGDMIEKVTFEKTTYNQLPYKFEAGTPNIADVIGFDAALTFLDTIGMDNITQHEKDILNLATEALAQFPEIKILGQAQEKVGVISFVMKNVHPHDIATILDDEGISIRAGHHCAMPLMERLHVPATARVSFGVYTTPDDIDALIQGIKKVNKVFA